VVSRRVGSSWLLAACPPAPPLKPAPLSPPLPVCAPQIVAGGPKAPPSRRGILRFDDLRWRNKIEGALIRCGMCDEEALLLRVHLQGDQAPLRAPLMAAPGPGEALQVLRPCRQLLLHVSLHAEFLL
jgi:hypothetical protein